MLREVFMPALSSTMTEGKIVSWEKSAGDKVEKGETILIVESDKADMDVEAFYEGYLAGINTPAGDSAAVGATIAYIAETEAEIAEAEKKAGGAPSSAPAPAASSPPPPAAEAAPPPVPPASPPPAPVIPASPPPAAASSNGGSGRLIASPRAKKLAKKLKVDLATIRGSGPNGRIVVADVEGTSGQAIAVPPVSAPVAAAPPPPVAPPAPIKPGEVTAFNTLQQAVVRNMNASLSVPIFHVTYAITTDALDRLYKQIKPKGVTMTAMLAKAIAMTLQKHPVVNASYTEQGTQYNGGINVAIAVAMPDGGLITPVLQNADQADIYSLSRIWKDLVGRARAKQLQPEEYSTGTFTLSNLGMFGVDAFDAILPPGQGSILAVGGSRPTVVADENGMLGVKKQMKVNITCDHRIIYGADAAGFLKDLADLIENNPESLTL